MFRKGIDQGFVRLARVLPLLLTARRTSSA